MADSSFDIVSEVDKQEADNALNQAAKEVAQRFDFMGFSETRYRPSSRLLPGRRYRTCDVLRSRLLRRRCNDRISRGSLHEPAR
jgi:uncharacterized protein YajQ (UPF0234 family)